MNENLHLVFTYPEGFPQEIIDYDISEIEKDNLKLHVDRHSVEAYAAMEWIVPTFFAAQIFKPYFESFLQEAGKEHFIVVKNAINKMLVKGKETNVQLISATQSTQKLSENYTQSLAVSIYFETSTNRRIKLLFDNNLDLSDWQNAIEDFSVYILDHYQNFPNDKLSNEIKDLSPKQYYTIYVKINPDTKNLEFHDDHTLIQEIKKP